MDSTSGCNVALKMAYLTEVIILSGMMTGICGGIRVMSCATKCMIHGFLHGCPVQGSAPEILTIVDDFTEESIDIVVDHGISALYVARAGPVGVRQGRDTEADQAGKPTQNAYIESFNGKFRDECFNEHWFTSLAQARAVIAAWRNDYDRRKSMWDNEARPHSALDYLCPAIRCQAQSNIGRSYRSVAYFNGTLLEPNWPD